ncbi:MAG TPA: hypothetical protein VGL05_28625 [Kribbella sp.]
MDVDPKQVTITSAGRSPMTLATGQVRVGDVAARRCVIELP